MSRFQAYRVHADGKFGAGRFDTMVRTELDGLSPGKGKVLVNGATGGWSGSM